MTENFQPLYTLDHAKLVQQRLQIYGKQCRFNGNCDIGNALLRDTLIDGQYIALVCADGVQYAGENARLVGQEHIDSDNLVSACFEEGKNIILVLVVCTTGKICLQNSLVYGSGLSALEHFLYPDGLLNGFRQNFFSYQIESTIFSFHYQQFPPFKWC